MEKIKLIVLIQAATERIRSMANQDYPDMRAIHHESAEIHRLSETLKELLAKESN